MDWYIEQAGTSNADWTVLTALKNGEPVDYTGYLTALDATLASGADFRATDYERMALVKSNLGVDADWIRQVVEDYTGSEGIMSLIYGMILADSGDYVSVETRESYAKNLVELMVDSCGWGLGEHPDPDVTAMALQALAPYQEAYQLEVEEALTYLSSIQLESGAYQSYGVENPETTVQVLLALNSLGLDYLEDTRFIKDEHTLIDGIEQFAREDGYAHQLDGQSNTMATIQVRYGYACLQETAAEAESLEETESITDSETEIITEVETETTLFYEKISGTGLKTGMMLTAFLIFFGLALANLLQRRKKTALLFGILLLAAEMFLFFSKIESVTEHYENVSSGEMETGLLVVDLEGQILYEGRVWIENGATVFDQLLQMTDLEKAELSYQGTALLGNVYVQSLYGLAEMEAGPLSGWTYTVNGEYPNLSCSEVTLTAGDEVRWIYTNGEELP